MLQITDKITFPPYKHPVFTEQTLHTPDVFDGAWIAHAEVIPVGEVVDDPLGGGHAELVHVEDASLGHQPCLYRVSISSTFKVTFCQRFHKILSL